MLKSVSAYILSYVGYVMGIAGVVSTVAAVLIGFNIAVGVPVLYLGLISLALLVVAAYVAAQIQYGPYVPYALRELEEPEYSI
jgi:hypothetical protein